MFTFREWINQLRIEEAKNLLRQYPDKTINEIAQLTGFSDKSNFIRLFRKQPNLTFDAVAIDSGHGSYSAFLRLFTKKYGITPSEYRKLAAAKKKLEIRN
jgi:AraC-like DNA-binding protein